MKKRMCAVLLFLVILLSGCGLESNLKDGFYTAEMSDYSFGWKEYLCILVKNNKIVYAEFNARDASGYIKSWDNSYMRNMGSVCDTYPNEYTREYVSQLIETQTAGQIDALTGATSSADNFDKLSLAVVAQALAGDTSVAVVQSGE